MVIRKKLSKMHDIYGKHLAVPVDDNSWVAYCPGCRCFLVEDRDVSMNFTGKFHAMTADDIWDGVSVHGDEKLNLNRAATGRSGVFHSKRNRKKLARYLHEIGWKPLCEWDMQKWVDIGNGGM